MYRNRILYPLTALVFFFSPLSNLAAAEFNYGASWLRMEETSRLMWVWGAGEGQDLLLEELKDAARNVKEHRLSSQKADTLAKIMTQYYQDAANHYVPWKYMAVVATMKLAGKTEAEVEERLRLLREYAEWACTQRGNQP